MGKDAASGLGGLAGAASAATPWVSLGLGAANIGMSLVEASKQKELQRAADRTAEQAAAEQKRLLSQNFFDALQVPTEAYDRALMANTAQQQQAMSALQEGDPRLLLGGVGKVQAVTNEQNAQDREALANRLFQLDTLQSQQANITADQLSNLEGQRLAGAQEASAAARKAALEQQQNALKAGGKLLTGLTGMIPEYSKTDINSNNTDMSTVLTPATMVNTGIGAESQLQSNTSNTLDPLYNRYSWGSISSPSIESQLLGSTNNVLSGFRFPG